MNPTLLHGHWVLVDTLQMYWRKPKNGDIVILKDGSNQLIVKRIALTSKSSLLWHDDTLYIPKDKMFIHLDQHVREELVKEPYLNDNLIFILGDNMPKSYDSRFYGAIPKHQIIGRVIGKSHI